MTPTPMTRLAEARPEVARRPHTVMPPAERAALLRSITGVEPTVSPYVAPESDAVELDLRARPGRSRRPLLLAAAVLLVVAAIGLGLVVRDDSDAPPVPAAEPAPTTPAPDPGPLPAGFDPATASPVFRAAGSVDDVTARYLEDSFDITAPLSSDPAVVDGDQATSRWRFGNETEGTIAQGDVLLRRDPSGWVVVASTVDGISLSSVRHTGDRVTGTVERTGQDNALFVDLLSRAGLPIVDTIEDDGPRRTSIPVDVPVDGPVILRTTVLGGTVLGVGEVALDPPPIEVDAGSGIGAVRVEERLDGTCVGLASGEGRVCTSAADELWPPDVWHLQLGPTVHRGDRVLITGFVHPSVSTVQVRTADGAELDGATSRTAVDDGAFFVIAVPIVDGPVSVELQGGSGEVLDTVELSGLLPVGG